MTPTERRQLPTDGVACEVCEDPAVCRDVDGVPLCQGCMDQLISEWNEAGGKF